MNPDTRRRTIVITLVAVVLAAIISWISTAPDHCIAVVRVVDAKGRPIQGAIIQAEGMRTKSGPYRSGWYGWNTERHGVTKTPIASDADGFVQLPYPKYVFERIETGALCLSADHPDYVPDRPEVDVATALPAGAPLRKRFEDLVMRIRLRTVFTRPPPIVLQRGATVVITARGNWPAADAQLFAQISVEGSHEPTFWARPQTNVLASSRVPTGGHTLRAVLLSTNASPQFSDVVPISAAEGETNQLVLDLKPGATVRGRLSSDVPRPVANGRVVANVWPSGIKPQENPPTWHSWSPIAEDGTFTIASLPAGDLEIVALCDGYVSTNGPGQYQTRYRRNTLSVRPTSKLQLAWNPPRGSKWRCSTTQGNRRKV